MDTSMLRTLSPVAAGDRAVVVGAGASGEAAARLLAALGVRVRLLDLKSENVSPAFRAFAHDQEIEILCGPHAPEQFQGARLVVTSPGIPLRIFPPLLAQAGDIPLMGEMELALHFITAPILAITGTSGKTTTASLAAAMLEEAGKKVFLGGNIGTPLSRFVLSGEQADVLVLEMSSFQLQTCTSLHPRVAVLLNLVENHLDHHKDMAEYIEAKFRIFALQTPEDDAFVAPEWLEECQRRGVQARLTALERVAAFPGLRLMGAHNAANAEAAFQACRVFGVSREVAVKAAAGFAPIRHRLEVAAVHGGVTYINDSKCTTVDALRVALMSCTGPVLLLAGGHFKGGDVASVKNLLQEKVKAIALYGGSREVFEAAWAQSVPLTWDVDLPAALARLRGCVAPGDVVLLAPATSSYDQYKNYEERGDHFCRLVKELV